MAESHDNPTNPVQFHPPTKTPGQVAELWQSYLASRLPEARNRLVVHYSALVYNQAARLTRLSDNVVSYEEICEFAFDGLIDAVETYFPSPDLGFDTFARQRIDAAVRDGLLFSHNPGLRAKLKRMAEQFAKEAPDPRSVSPAPGDLANNERKKLTLRAQIGEFTPAEEAAVQLGELIRALNAYHIAAGGSGLIIDEWQILCAAGEPAEVQS